MNNTATVDEAASYLKTRSGRTPRVAVVLGSGLKRFADGVDDGVVIPYEDIPGFPEPSVKGHSGSLVFGRIGQKDVVCQLGRYHLYEGWDEATVVLPIRVFGALGVEVLIVTNAAGGLSRNSNPPHLMLIRDHINCMFRSPLAGPVVHDEMRFPDMASAYDPKLNALAQAVGRECEIDLQPGVYASVLGPSYETPAEVRMLDRLGANAVGMSTVPEVIVARARGMRVLGISTITNLAAGISPIKLSHDEVLEAGKEMGTVLTRLISGIVQAL